MKLSAVPVSLKATSSIFLITLILVNRYFRVGGYSAEMQSLAKLTFFGRCHAKDKGGRRLGY